MSEPRPPLTQRTADPGQPDRTHRGRSFRGRRHHGARPRRRNPGIALVEAMVLGLIAVIAALVLASRLLSSRFASFSRSDTFSAREAAEYGLNEMHAQLNSDQYAYLWVTKFNKWTGANKITKSDLNACSLYALNSSGTEIDPEPPSEGIASAKTISTSGDNAVVQYQVTAFTPPALSDSDSDTAKQTDFCGDNHTQAAYFGNLYGGSAQITVTGTVTRGGRSTSFKLSRTPHVYAPGALLNFSFMILGNAYDAKGTGQDPNTFGNAADIALLRSADGDICYGTPTGCYSTKVGKQNINKLTIIGCVLLDACQVNNIDIVPGKSRSKWCQDKKTKKKRKGFLCNTFQQAAIITMPASYKPPSTWNITTLIKPMECDTQDKSNPIRCKGNSSETLANSNFPYYTSTAPTSITSSLKNSSLVKGCYLNNSSGALTDSANSSTTAINCIFSGNEAKVDGKGKITTVEFITGKNNLVVDTKLLPVNIFLYDVRNTVTPVAGKSYEYYLKDAGIQNSDITADGWSRLRILGRPLTAVSDPSVTPIRCNEARIISTKDNDINNAFVWLPNGWLDFNKTDSKDSSYNVIWSCKFTGPTKGKGGYTIITPLEEQLVRLAIPSVVPGISRDIGSTYRALGSGDKASP